MEADPPGRHSLLGPFQRVCYLVHPGASTHRSDGGEPRQLHAHVRGSCDLLGDLEQQPAAGCHGCFVMLLGSPAAMEAAAAREATAAPAAVHARADLVPTGGLARALRRSRQRPPGPPDGHLAAVLPRFDRGALAAAMRRACGQPN
jgi:hypothetical protein